MEIIECQTEEAIHQNYALLAQLYPQSDYPHFTFETFKSLLPSMREQGYRQIAAYENGRCVGVAGFNLTTRLYKGHVMRLNDLIVDKAHRGKGAGKLLLDWVEKEARQMKVSAVVLDCGLPRKDSHRFYEREGYYTHALHFAKQL